MERPPSFASTAESELKKYYIHITCRLSSQVSSQVCVNINSLSFSVDIATLLRGLNEHLPLLPPLTLNTALLAIMWSVGKSRNNMVFDADRLSTTYVIAAITDHLRLWMVRFPHRVDLSSLRRPRLV